MLMSIYVCLFGMQMVVDGSLEGELEVMIIVASNAAEGKFNCKYISCCFEQEVV